jgi:hypothetical protein
VRKGSTQRPARPGIGSGLPGRAKSDEKEVALVAAAADLRIVGIKVDSRQAPDNAGRRSREARPTRIAGPGATHSSPPGTRPQPAPYQGGPR